MLEILHKVVQNVPSADGRRTRVRFKLGPTRYREVVLTSWVCGMSDCDLPTYRGDPTSQTEPAPVATVARVLALINAE